MKAVDFTFDTPFKKGLRLSQEVKKADRTFLIFLRYFGCTSCQVNMVDLKEEYENFKARNAQVLVVLQSRGEIAKDGSERFDLPYDIVLDPQAELYKLYNVPSAGSKEAWEASKAAFTPEQAAKREGTMKRRDELGLTHGEYEGDEYQLPAYFLLDGDMNILKEHRAENVADMPLADEYLEMI